MRVNLRFGMHKDIEVIHQCSTLFNGLVIPSNILAHQIASTGAFVCSMPTHDYIIDPGHWSLRSPRDRHRKDKDPTSLRPSIEKWCDAMHPALKATLLSDPSGAALTLADLPNIDECVSNNATFQLQSVGLASADKKTKKYLLRYAGAKATAPRCVLPPYFRFDAVGDAWYAWNVQAASKSVGPSGITPIAPVILCDASLLDTAAITRISGDYRAYSRVFLWMDDFLQSSVDAGSISKVRRLVKALSEAGVAVETLFGGFMMMMMVHDGLGAIAHGILYTQHKVAEQSKETGGAPERYYIPAFHDFRSLAQTNLILRKHPELVGGTPTSTAVMAGDPDRIFTFASRPDLLRKHFLEARQGEVAYLAAKPIGTIVADLRTTHGRYHASVASFTNPDAIMSKEPMKGLDYLLAWANAFS